MSQTIAEGICKISTPLLLSLGCIPVPESREGQRQTFQDSISLLMQGKFILVVPEDSDLEPDRATGISDFKHGFLRLGELYYLQTGGRLPFYPVAIHEAGWVMVGKPIVYNPQNDARQERLRMVNLLEQCVKSMHLDATEQQASESIFIKRKTL